MIGRVIAGHIVLQLAFDVGQQAGRADAKELRLQPLAAKFLGHHGEVLQRRLGRRNTTGRLETEYFMKAFENGADGVLVAGCLEGGCHFVEGNLCAKRRVNYTKEMLEEIGMGKERLRMVNVSAAMARPLADIITDMVETVRKLGPSPIKQSSFAEATEDKIGASKQESRK